MPGAADEVPSELVAEKYRLTRLLGRGGMGSVWEGVHTSLGTRVAVKFIDAAYAEDEEARNRFRNEARAAATLQSKHVVQVYDHGVADDGRPYIVMEFLSGEPLDKRLDRVGRLSLQDTANIMMQTCRALSKAHDAGIVHRDLKPENVFLVWDDEDNADIAKVVDFGIAKFTDPSLGASSVTRTGSVLGTPYYMSPEQARGLRTVDYRSDLWSLGVITFRCVAGRLPFEGEAIGDLLVKICTAPLPVPSTLVPGLPPAFDAWFARALAREPDQRFGSARELADELLAACGLAQRLPMSSIVDPSSPHQAAPSNAEGSAARPQAAVVTPGIGGVTPPPAALTGAPTTQTPAPPGKSRVGLVVALAVTGMLVLGVASAAAYKLGKSPAAPTKASAPERSASIAVAAPSAAASNAAPPVASAKPSVEPVPSTSVAEKPSAAPLPSAAKRPVAAPHRHATVKAHAATTHKSGGSTGEIELGY